MILSDKKERTIFIKFSIVGISGTLIDIGFFNLLNQHFGTAPITAKALSFTIAVLNNFFLNRLWTFPGPRGTSFFKQMGQYSIVSIVGLLINTSIFALLDKSLILFFQKTLTVNFIFSPTVVGHNISIAFATIVVLFWNYYANRLWTFRDIK